MTVLLLTIITVWLFAGMLYAAIDLAGRYVK